MGNPQALPANGGQGPEGKLGLAGPYNREYLSSRKVSLGSRLYSSSPQLQAAPGGGPADACPIDNALLQLYPKLITEWTRSNTRRPRTLTPSPALPGRCFFPSCKERKERKEKGMESELTRGAGELFLCPILSWQRLHSAAMFCFPGMGFTFIPPGWRRGTTLEEPPLPASLGHHQPGIGAICQHHGFAWVAKGARHVGQHSG